MLSNDTIARRIEDLDWFQIGRDLDERGYAKTPRVLFEDECDEVKGLFGEEDRFRNTVDMRRVRFGSGIYKYFNNPLPEAVQGLREAFYPPLSKVANEWARKLGAKEAYPDALDGFLERCHEAGQTRPTPLILRYEEGGYNALHPGRLRRGGLPLPGADGPEPARGRLHGRGVPARDPAPEGAVDRRGHHPGAGRSADLP